MLLKAFALMRFNNENLVSFLYSRVAEQVKTLQTQVISRKGILIVGIAVCHVDHCELEEE